MSEIKESKTDQFINGFSFATAKMEADASAAEMKKVNTVAGISGKMDTSLFRIKTEPNLLTDCDIAPATVNSFETMLTAIKEEIDSDTDISNNNNVTVHLLIPETILNVKTEVDIQANREEYLLANHSLVSSDMPATQSALTETGEDSIHSGVSIDIIHDESSATSAPFGSTPKQPRKRKYDTEFLTLDMIQGPTEQSSTSEAVTGPSEYVKKSRGSKKGSMNKKTSDDVSEFDVIDLESPVPNSSTELTQIVLESQQPKCRGRKKGSINKVRKEKTKEMVVCPFCDRKMVKHYFPYHARVHTDEKPFKCPKCPYTSHFKSPLLFHMDSHHPTEGYGAPTQ